MTYDAVDSVLPLSKNDVVDVEVASTFFLLLGVAVDVVDAPGDSFVASTEDVDVDVVVVVLSLFFFGFWAAMLPDTARERTTSNTKNLIRYAFCASPMILYSLQPMSYSDG